MQKIIFSLICSAAIFTLTGCAGLSGEIPGASGEDSAALAISLEMDSRTTILESESINPQVVYFVKLDSRDDSLQKDRFRESNFIKESLLRGFQFGSTDLFLLDVEPGIYAAVGMIGEGANSKAGFYVYFPRELVTASIVEVRPGEMAYMGKYQLAKVNGRRQMDNPDELQAYYNTNNMFEASDQRLQRLPGFARQYMWTQFHSPGLKDASSGAAAEVAFLSRQRGGFSNTDWQEMVDNRLDALRAE